MCARERETEREREGGRVSEVSAAAAGWAAVIYFYFRGSSARGGSIASRSFVGLFFSEFANASGGLGVAGSLSFRFLGNNFYLSIYVLAYYLIIN